MYIDDLKLPESLDTTAALQNFDTQRRTISNKLITKLAPNEKWIVTVKFATDVLALDFQKKFYEKCLQMRSTDYVCLALFRRGRNHNRKVYNKDGSYCAEHKQGTSIFIQKR